MKYSDILASQEAQKADEAYGKVIEAYESRREADIEYDRRLADITANRHRDNEQSQQAHTRLLNHKDQQRADVLEVIRRYPAGVSMKEVAAIMGVPFNTVSGRGSELKRGGLVVKTGDIRDGSAVLRAVKVILTADELIDFLM